MTAIESKLLQDQYARIAELEAENAELKKYYQVLLEMPLRVSDRKPTREQIAGLVKGLEWEGSRASVFYGNYYVEGFPANWQPVLYGLWFGPTFENKDEARAAAEAHHRETILSLLNL